MADVLGEIQSEIKYNIDVAIEAGMSPESLEAVQGTIARIIERGGVPTDDIIQCAARAIMGVGNRNAREAFMERIFQALFDAGACMRRALDAIIRVAGSQPIIDYMMDRIFSSAEAKRAHDTLKDIIDRTIQGRIDLNTMQREVMCFVKLQDVPTDVMVSSSIDILSASGIDVDATREIINTIILSILKAKTYMATEYQLDMRNLTTVALRVILSAIAHPRDEVAKRNAIAMAILCVSTVDKWNRLMGHFRAMINSSNPNEWCEATIVLLRKLRNIPFSVIMGAVIRTITDGTHANVPMPVLICITRCIVSSTIDVLEPNARDAILDGIHFVMDNAVHCIVQTIADLSRMDNTRETRESYIQRITDAITGAVVQANLVPTLLEFNPAAVEHAIKLMGIRCISTNIILTNTIAAFAHVGIPIDNVPVARTVIMGLICATLTFLQQETICGVNIPLNLMEIATSAIIRAFVHRGDNTAMQNAIDTIEGIIMQVGLRVIVHNAGQGAFDINNIAIFTQIGLRVIVGNVDQGAFTAITYAVAALITGSGMTINAAITHLITADIPLNHNVMCAVMNGFIYAALNHMGGKIFADIRAIPLEIMQPAEDNILFAITHQGDGTAVQNAIDAATRMFVYAGLIATINDFARHGMFWEHTIGHNMLLLAAMPGGLPVDITARCIVDVFANIAVQRIQIETAIKCLVYINLLYLGGSPVNPSNMPRGIMQPVYDIVIYAIQHPEEHIAIQDIANAVENAITQINAMPVTNVVAPGPNEEQDVDDVFQAVVEEIHEATEDIVEEEEINITVTNREEEEEEEEEQEEEQEVDIEYITDEEDEMSI